MSYCRWSSDDFRCYIYAYADANGGYTIHVASKRVVGDVPPLDWSSTERLVESYKAQRAFMDAAQYVPIGLPYDGETFWDPDLASFRDRLASLKEIGYYVPDGVFEDIGAEMAEVGDD